MNSGSPIRALSNSHTMTLLARLGLTARGLVYLLMGALALLVANGSHLAVDQKNALSQLLRQPYGFLLVTCMAVGFAAYAVWRLSEATFGVVGAGRRVGPRLQSLLRGLIYASLAATTISLLMGSRQSQSMQQQGYARDVLAMSGGRWIVAGVGLCVAVTGAVMMEQGATAYFMRYFPRGSTSMRARNAIRLIGRIGTLSRGLIFVLAGALIVLAGWIYKPAKASGVDAAVNTIQAWPRGNLFLTCVAVGLLLFGVYGLCEARYRRI